MRFKSPGIGVGLFGEISEPKSIPVFVELLPVRKLRKDNVVPGTKDENGAEAQSTDGSPSGAVSTTTTAPGVDTVNEVGANVPVSEMVAFTGVSAV